MEKRVEKESFIRALEREKFLYGKIEIEKRV